MQNGHTVLAGRRPTSSVDTLMIVHARIKPNSKKGPLVVTDDEGHLELYVRAPAVDGKANKAAIELLAKHFGVPRSKVRLTGGPTSRHKRFEVDAD